MPWSLSGAGFGAAASMTAGGLVVVIGWTKSSGAGCDAGGVVAAAFGAPVTGAGAGATLGSTATAGTCWAAEGPFCLVGAGLGATAVCLWAWSPGVGPMFCSQCHARKKTRSAPAARAAGRIRPGPRLGCCAGSTGRNCRPGESGGGTCCCACLARFNASLIKLMRQCSLPIRGRRDR